MSAELLGAAFKADIRPHAYKLVMLKLIDAARDDGTRIYPSVETIANAAGVSERHTKRVLHAFVEAKILAVTKEGGRGRGDTREYALDVALLLKLGTSLRVTFENGKGTFAEKGDMAAPSEKRVTPETLKGDSGVTQPLSRPLSERDTRTRDGEAEPRRRFEFLPPDTERIDKIFDALCLAWERGAKSGRGAIGNSAKARAAIADMDEADDEACVERAPRYLAALKGANKYAQAIETYVRNREFQHHPPPRNAAADVQPIALPAYSAALWCIAWNAFRKARDTTRDQDHWRRRFTDALGWLKAGATLPAQHVPPEADVQGLVPVPIGSDEHRAWTDYAARHGVTLPVPDRVPVVYVPAKLPPDLVLTGLTPYRLVMPVRIAIRGKTWFWRYWKRAEGGARLVTEIGQRRLDVLEKARNSEGNEETDTGPLPLPADLAAMVEVDTLSDGFAGWATFVAARGSSLDLWPHKTIWVPSKHPAWNFGLASSTEGAAA